MINKKINIPLDFHLVFIIGNKIYYLYDTISLMQELA